MDIRNKKIKNVFKISRDAWRGKRTAFWVEIVWFSLVERWTVDGRGPSLCLPSFPWSPRAVSPISTGQVTEQFLFFFEWCWVNFLCSAVNKLWLLREASCRRKQTPCTPLAARATHFSLLSYARAHTVGGEKWTVVKISIILVKLVSFILLVGLNRAYCCCHYQLKSLCHGKITLSDKKFGKV